MSKNAIEYACKWWLDVMTGDMHRRIFNEKIEELSSNIEYYKEAKEKFIRHVVESDEDCFVGDDKRKIARKLMFTHALLDASIEDLKEEAKDLKDKANLMEENLNFISSEQREALERPFIEFIKEKLEESANKCIYISVDENGEPDFEIGMFCHNYGICGNCDNKISPFPPHTEMLITAKDVFLRLDENENWTNVFDENDKDNAMEF